MSVYIIFICKYLYYIYLFINILNVFICECDSFAHFICECRTFHHNY